jgi:two-component system, cell cycle sensor histidine kinase and response regulator CckA
MQSSSGVRILIVDDEEALLRLLLAYLTRLGYSVTGCGTGSAAVDLFTRSDPEFSLVVMDLTLPDRQGDEVAVELMQLNPRLRVLLSSGYVVTPDIFPAEMRSRVGVLQKPFLPKMLVREVERLLALDA